MLDFKQDILSVLGRKEDPTKMKTILRELGLPQSDRQYVRSLLKELVREGRVVKTGVFFWVPDGKQRSLEIKREKTMIAQQESGRLSVSTRGSSFLERPNSDDWVVSEFGKFCAIHGDRVRVRKLGRDHRGRVQCEIVAIESFGRTQMLGVFEDDGPRKSFKPFGQVEVAAWHLHGFPLDVAEGIVGRWSRQLDGTWRYEGELGSLMDPMVDEVIALAENEIHTQFPVEVLAQAEALPDEEAFTGKGREDFRTELVFTVDGETARDFDDALHFKPLDEERIEVGIHIADVSSFVPEGSPLDTWAANQGNSTYLPHKAIPMLPERLSNQLCSLNPGVPRYTLSVVATLNHDGEVLDYRFCKGLIESRFRLTYTQVHAMGVLRDQELRDRDADLTQAIDTALSLSRALRQRRLAEGGLSLDKAEFSIRLNEDQTLAEVYETRQNDANRMIEAFMVLANECAASWFSARGVDIPYRVHDWPDPDRLATLGEFLLSLGLPVPSNLLTQPGLALSQMIPAIANRPNGEVLQTQILKTLKLAQYQIENRGHFGLASERYAHFTSPIRRYADLIVHRRLSTLLSNQKLAPEHFDNTQLEEVCSHISDRERRSMRAEQTFVQLKLLRHMLDEVGNVFEGVIAEVKKFGLFVTLKPYPVTGLVHVENLSGDFYEHIPERMALVGKRNQHELGVGGLLAVQVVRVDFVNRKIDLIPVGQTSREPARKRDKHPGVKKGFRRRKRR